jgi:predicted RNA-binding Zn ribbon-like protein
VDTSVHFLAVSSSSTKKAEGTPRGLRLLRDFVNTFEAELDTDFEGEEHLPDPPALAAWLRDHDIHVAGTPTDEDLATVVAFREALRRLLLANNGFPVDREASRLLGDYAADVSLRVEVGADGSASLEPAGDGIRALFARLLAAAARAQEDGSWQRLKACPASDCHWAFFDESRNRSRTWCAMEVCGNRSKTRSYRARKAKS